MNAFDSIVAKKLRENAGALASNRFAYQLDWGLKKLLELEESNLPYTVIFATLLFLITQKNESTLDIMREYLR